MSGSTIKAKATLSQRVALFFLSPLFPWLAAILATGLIATTIDVAEDLSWSIAGPGLTFDEGFNIEVGVYLVESMAQAGLGSFHPETQLEIYQHKFYNPDHPPLGRMALGLAHHFVRRTQSDPLSPVSVVSAARIASAVEFGLLILLIGIYTRRWFGPLVSCSAVVSVLCMPRVFGHAQLAALEMCTCLTFTAFVLVFADCCWAKNRLRIRQVFLPGLLLGLVFLTKIQAILLLPVILVWVLWNWRVRGLLPGTALLFTAFLVFFVGWPWLWIDPLEHLAEYFGRATERAHLNCFYLGKKYADVVVPWHYPLVMFAVTMPLGFLIAGVVGLINRTGDENSRHALFDRRSQLIFGAWLLPLIVFALPGVAVYDGVRLFLTSFPLFSIFVGLGASRLIEGLQRRHGTALPLGLILLSLAGPVYNIITLHPCQLSYYSEAVAGLWKAEELGFETSYWGESLTPEFLKECVDALPEGATIEVAPVLHPQQLDFMRQGSWLRHRPDIQLRPYDDQRRDLSPYVLVLRRRADPWASLNPPPPGTERLVSVERQGVVLAEFLRLP